MLPRKNRLNKNHFQHLYDHGKKFRGEYGMLIVKKREDLSQAQFAFVVSKKIGNAVLRHKMTRLLREIAREKIEEGKGMESIYVAYKYCSEYEKLEKDFNKQFEDALRTT
jgi:ribonuclease P protein component